MSSRTPSLRAVACACLGFATSATGLFGQSAITLNDTTRTGTSPNYTYGTWKPVFTLDNTYLYEASGDVTATQGQQPDLVSVTSGAPGFFIRGGTLLNAGGTAVDSLAFRVISNKALGNKEAINLGLDYNLDGGVDLYLTMTGTTLSLNAIGTGAQTTSATSSIGTALSVGFGGGTATTSLTLSTGTTGGYNSLSEISLPAASTEYTGWTAQTNGGGGNDTTDTMYSFGVTLSDLNTALGLTGSNVLTTTSMMRWMAFTTINNNAAIADVYGLGNVSGNSTVTYASFVQVMNANGQPIPESAAYGLTMIPCLAAFFALRRPRRTSVG